MKVPIQSPSQLRSMGFPSLHAEIKRYVPSSSLLAHQYRIITLSSITDHAHV